MKQIILLTTTILFFQIVFSQNSIEKDFKKYFKKHGVDGCFAMYNHTDNEYIRYNSDLCDTGYIPASTFKIPHAIIALEEGIVKDTSQIFKWDGHVWDYNAWNKDQTLKTSIKYSCIWVYFKFAQKLGIDKYNNYVESFDYGNKNLNGPPTRFWLKGSLRISANEQIEFLRKMYHYELEVSKNSIDIVKDLIIIEETDSYKLSGKTGGGDLSETEYILWLVGYFEKDGKVWFHALNFKTDDFNKTKKARYEITKDILRDLELI